MRGSVSPASTRFSAAGQANRNGSRLAGGMSYAEVSGTSREYGPRDDMLTPLLLIGFALLVAGSLTMSYAVFKHVREPRPTFWKIDLYNNEQFLTPAGLRLRHLVYRVLYPIGLLCVLVAFVIEMSGHS